MMLFNSQLICDRDSAIDFLDSLGMDKFDIENFINFLGVSDEAEYWENLADSYKNEAEVEFELRHDFLNEVQNLAEELSTGKGGTKAAYAQEFLNLCEKFS